MNKVLQTVLLVDDDNACNFFNRRLLKNKHSITQVQDARNGRDALAIIKQAADANQPLPNLIFLDLNMPVMSGWEFLNEFKKLPDAVKQQVVIIILSSSINPDDKARAKTYTEVAAYENKYLNDESLARIIEEHFGIK